MFGRCPKSHKLVTANRSIAWNCDVCKQWHAPNTKSEHCAACDFDACAGCSRMRCPAGHPIGSLRPRDVTFHCDICETRNGKGSQAYTCHACNYDVCARCATTGGAAAPNSGGASVAALSISTQSRNSDDAARAKAGASAPNVAAMHDTVVYIDFDQFAAASVADIAKLQFEIMERLVRHGYAITTASIRVVAYGVPRSFGNPKVLEQLHRTAVEMRLVCGAKKEATDREMHRDASTSSAKTVVLVSSDMDFVVTVKDLVVRGKRVVVVHGAAPGSAHASNIALFATENWSWTSDLGVGSPPPGGPTAAACGAITATGVRVDGAGIVPFAQLESNGMIARLKARPEITEAKQCRHWIKGEPCSGEACGFAHIKRAPAPGARRAPPPAAAVAAPEPATVRIEGVRVPVALLVPTRVVAFQQANPDKPATWCVHFLIGQCRRGTDCGFAHASTSALRYDTRPTFPTINYSRR